MAKLEKIHDPYIRHTADIKPRAGFSHLQEYRATPGPSLVRRFEMVRDSEEKRFGRDQRTVLCKGAAVGIDAAGTVGHFRKGLRWIGFLEGNSETEVAIRTRGVVILRIEGAGPADLGRSVFCGGPNTFGFSESLGPAIGAVRFFQDGFTAVSFRREGDSRPLILETR
jgi:hypothetical protein